MSDDFFYIDDGDDEYASAGGCWWIFGDKECREAKKSAKKSKRDSKPKKDKGSKDKSKNNKSSNSGGGMISLGGSDWLGLGATFGALSQGTAMCGSKPISGSTEAYDTCIARSLEIQAQSVADAQKIAKGKNQTKMIVIGLVSVAVLILAVVIIRSRRKG